MKCLIRSNADENIGLGHLSRCLTLANGLAERDYRCVFLCESVPDDFQKTLLENGHDLALLKANVVNSPELELAQLQDKYLDNDGSTDFDLVVIDHYGIDAMWERHVRAYTKRILVIDDLANRLHDCDFLLDQTLGRNADEYRKLIPANAHALCGSQFALLKPEYPRYQALAKSRRKNLSEVKQVAISFGGSAQAPLLRRVLSALVDFDRAREFQISLILSAFDYQNRAFLSFVDELDLDVDVVTNLKDMASVWRDSDLAIGACGTTSWERASLGLPSVTCVIADNQKQIAKALEEAGASRVLELGTEIDERFESRFICAIEELCDLRVYHEMSQHCLNVCDGRGLERILSKLC